MLRSLPRPANKTSLKGKLKVLRKAKHKITPAGETQNFTCRRNTKFYLRAKHNRPAVEPDLLCFNHISGDDDVDDDDEDDDDYDDVVST